MPFSTDSNCTRQDGDLPAAAMALKVGSYTRATKTAAYHRAGQLNLDVANIT
jgi:hypothetical protein